MAQGRERGPAAGGSGAWVTCVSHGPRAAGRAGCTGSSAGAASYLVWCLFYCRRLAMTYRDAIDVPRGGAPCGRRVRWAWGGAGFGAAWGRWRVVVRAVPLVTRVESGHCVSRSLFLFGTYVAFLWENLAHDVRPGWRGGGGAGCVGGPPEGQVGVSQMAVFWAI